MLSYLSHTAVPLKLFNQSNLNTENKSKIYVQEWVLMFFSIPSICKNILSSSGWQPAFTKYYYEGVYKQQILSEV